MFTFQQQYTFHRGDKYFNEVKKVHGTICLSFCLMKALPDAYKMKAYSLLTRNLKSITSTIHSSPVCLTFPSVACVAQLKASRGTRDFFKSHTDQGPFAVTAYISQHEHMILEKLLSKALTIPGTLVYYYHY